MNDIWKMLSIVRASDGTFKVSLDFIAFKPIVFTAIPPNTFHMPTFRTATRSDAASIAAIHTLNWQQNYRGAFSDDYLDNQAAEDRLNVWTNRLTHPAEHQHIIVATQNNEVVGFSCLQGKADPVYGTLLDNLHVGSGQKGQGIGKQLLERSLAWTFKNFPQHPMFLWVLTQNQKGIRFYERLGGKQKEQTIHHSPLGLEVSVYRYVWYP